MYSLEQQLFGVLSKEYCMYFYYLSVFGFVFMIFVLASSIGLALSKPKDMKFVTGTFLAVLGYAVFYFQNRLLYSMCSHSL
jgi:hypothetical protein